VPLEPGKVVGIARFRSIHRDFYKGVYVPAGDDVAASIRFRPQQDPDWGYADHWIEEGRTLAYTGQGGPPQDQGWNRWNMGLRNACDRRTPVHVFEPLRGTPKTYKYWGQFVIARWTEQYDESQQRVILRFVLEVPD
jgi:hypothetical protein